MKNILKLKKKKECKCKRNEQKKMGDIEKTKYHNTPISVLWQNCRDDYFYFHIILTQVYFLINDNKYND